MVSQNIQTMNYVTSVPEQMTVSSSCETDRDAALSGRIFHQVICAIALILAPVFLLVLFNGINVQKEYAMQSLRSEVMTMAKENDVMRLEVSKLEAPVRIQHIAEKELHMSLPLRVIHGEADPVVPAANKGR